MTLLRRNSDDAVALTVLAALCIGILLPSLVAAGVPQHGDMSFPYSLTNWIDRFFPMWNPRSETSNLQSIDRFWSTIPILMIERWFHVNMSVSVRLAYAGETLLVASSGYVFARAFLSRIEGARQSVPYLSAASAFVFTFSPWALSQVQAPWFYLAYGLTPVLLVLFDRAIHLGHPRSILASAFVFSVIASTPQFAGFTLLALGAWLIATLVTPRAAGLTRLALIRRASFCACAALALNLYWIVPGIVLQTQGVITPGYFMGLQTLHELSQNSGLLHVLSGTNSWISWYRPPLLGRPLYEDLQLLLPTLAGVGVWLTWRFRSSSPYVLWMTVVGVLSVAVATIPSLPYVNDLFYWCVLHLPVGWLLRVPQKTSYLYWVVVPPLAVGAVARIASSDWRIGSHLRSRMFGSWRGQAGSPLAAMERWAPALLVICVVFVGWGLTSGVKAVDLYTTYYRPTPLPSQYDAAFAYLKGALGAQFQAMDLAPYDYGTGLNQLRFEDSYTWAPNKIVGYGIGASIPVRAISTYAQQSAFSYFAYEVGHYALVDPPVARSLLQAAGVEFVLFHNDIVGAEAVGRAELHGLTSVLSVARTYGSVYILRVPSPELPLWSVIHPAISRGLLGAGLGSAVAVPPSGFIQADQWPIPHQSDQLLARLTRPQKKGIVSAISLAQWFLSQQAASFVWYPGETDVNDFSLHHWNVMYPEYAYGGGYPWRYVAAGLGLPRAGVGSLQAGLVVESVADGGLATITYNTKAVGSVTGVGVKFLRSAVGGVVRVQCRVGTGQSSIHRINTFGKPEGTGWAFMSCGGRVGDARNVSVSITSETGTDVVMEVVGLSGPELNTAVALSRALGSAKGLTTVNAIHGATVNGARWTGGTQVIGTVTGSKTRPALVATTLPCGVDWVAHIGKKALQGLCVDGFFQGFLVPAGVRGSVVVQYGAETLSQWWLLISILCATGLVGSGLWLQARRRWV